MKTKTNLLTAGILLATLMSALGQPDITTPPQSRTNVAGTDATFTVLATGTEPLAYQWRFITTDLVGKTNDTLIVTNVQAANAGGYSVVVTNVEGAVTSVVATLTVLIPPKITRQPTNQTASLFADATFRVTATGDPQLNYQWRFNDGDLLGRTNTTLTVTNVQRTNAGNYSVIVTNLSGSVTSQLVTLTITPFNSLYCFGFSWTDTRGIGCNWPAPDYYGGRACNGPMWPEFLSTNLGLPYIAANNYAFCGATAADVLNQTAGFPAPPKPQLSLYCLWTGDSDFLRAYPPGGSDYLNVTNEVAWTQLIQTIISRNSNAVNRLYTKGARTIVTENLDDFSREPDAHRAFGTNTAGLSRLSEYIARCNTGFIEAMNTYSQTKPDLRILFIDVFSKFNDVLANPAQYGFTKTTVDALGDTNLTNRSFTGPGADYVFWDGGHVTSKCNALFAAWHLETLTNSILEKLNVTITAGSPSIQLNRLLIGRDYTLQSSTNLSNWEDVQNFTAAAGTNQWTSASSSANAAFYRLKWQP